MLETDYDLTEIHGKIKEKYHLENTKGLTLLVEDKTLVFNSKEDADEFIQNHEEIQPATPVLTCISFYDNGAILATKKVGGVVNV